MRIGQRQLLYQQLAQASSLVYPSTHQYQSVAYCCLEKEGEDVTYYSGGADLASTFLFTDGLLSDEFYSLLLGFGCSKYRPFGQFNCHLLCLMTGFKQLFENVLFVRSL